MSVPDELRALGHLGGPATIAMLTARFRSAVQPFPTLKPPGGWTAGALEDVLHDFLAEKLEDLTNAVLTVRDDETATLKVTSRVMKRWLIDQARKTDTGAIRVRLEELVHESDLFVKPNGQGERWALVGAEQVSSVDIESLVAAARAVPGVKPVRWRDENRRAPMASGPDLLRVLEAVLERAGGSVESGVLVTVFQRRFGVTLTSFVPLEEDDTLPERLAEPPVFNSVELDEAAVRAAQAYAQLSDRERRILLHLHDHRAVQDALGVGRTTAYTLIGKVNEALQALAGQDVDHAAVAAALVRLAERDFGAYGDDP
ncbi:hypothetical protein [Aquipuribacter hungaricus]|uniref:Uncharacterized protein n=1 Tax=Aquipuribacter hungaricus TaxID=545624 RepID=A0ABV7WGC9_9MICO